MATQGTWLDGFERTEHAGNDRPPRNVRPVSVENVFFKVALVVARVGAVGAEELLRSTGARMHSLDVVAKVVL